MLFFSIAFKNLLPTLHDALFAIAFGAGYTLSSHFPTYVLVLYQVTDGIGHFLYVTILNEDAVFAVGDDVAWAAVEGKSHGWYSCGHSLGDDQSETLVIRSYDEY